MAYQLTYWAVQEDCRRLARHADGIDPLFRALLDREAEYARLGAITPAGDDWLEAVLARAHADWVAAGLSSAATVDGANLPAAVRDWAAGTSGPPRGRTDVRRGAKLALVLGSLIRQACDRTVGAVQAEVAGRDGNAAPALAAFEVAAYYDAHIFRQIYRPGAVGAFDAFLRQHARDPDRALEEFLLALCQRALLACHTIIPDTDDVDRWLDHLFAAFDQMREAIGRYARIYRQPDPARLAQFEVETAFYRAEDPAVVVARALQRGEPVEPAWVEAALAPGANASAYGRAVEAGLAAWRQASAFWRDESERLTVTGSARRGRPEERVLAP